jgi:hypothetical protein
MKNAHTPFFVFGLESYRGNSKLTIYSNELESHSFFLRSPYHVLVLRCAAIFVCLEPGARIMKSLLLISLKHCSLFQKEYNSQSRKLCSCVPTNFRQLIQRSSEQFISRSCELFTRHISNEQREAVRHWWYVALRKSPLRPDGDVPRKMERQ